MTTALARDLPARHAPDVAVDQRPERIEGRGVAIGPALQESGDLSDRFFLLVVGFHAALWREFHARQLHRSPIVEIPGAGWRVKSSAISKSLSRSSRFLRIEPLTSVFAGREDKNDQRRHSYRADSHSLFVGIGGMRRG